MYYTESEKNILESIDERKAFKSFKGNGAVS